MARKWFKRITSAIAAVTVTLSTALLLAQTPAGQTDMAEHKQKMAEQKAMMAKMAAADQKLAGLVATMNAAKGEEKVAAIAAVLNELVAQRQQMHESCGMMTATEPAKPAAGAEHEGHHPAQ